MKIPLFLVSCIVFVFLSNFASATEASLWMKELSLTAAQIIVKKSWMGIPDSTVILAKKGNSIILAVIESKSGAIRAKTILTFKDECSLKSSEDAMPDEDTCEKFSLDLAPYRLSPAEMAIGVRWTKYSVYPAGESNAKQLALYSVIGATLAKVFEDKMEYSSTQRGPGDLLTGTCILNVSKNISKNHFDLERICTNKVEPLAENDSEPKKLAKSKKATEKFIWDGTRYLKQKKL